MVTSTVCRDGKGLFAGSPSCRPSLSNLDQRHILQVDPAHILPTGLKSEEYVKAFLQEFGIADINGSLVHTLPGKFPVVIDKGLFMDKVTGAWKATKGHRGPYVRLLARTILNPFEVWWVPVRLARRRAATQIPAPDPVIRCAWENDQRVRGIQPDGQILARLHRLLPKGGPHPKGHFRLC